jgi:hypothetical protein
MTRQARAEMNRILGNQQDEDYISGRKWGWAESRTTALLKVLAKDMAMKAGLIPSQKWPNNERPQ